MTEATKHTGFYDSNIHRRDGEAPLEMHLSGTPTEHTGTGKSPCTPKPF